MSEHFETAWKFLQLNSTEEQKAWLIKLDSRNKDTLSLITSLLILLFAANFSSFFFFAQPDNIFATPNVLIPTIVFGILFFVAVVLALAPRDHTGKLGEWMTTSGDRTAVARFRKDSPLSFEWNLGSVRHLLRPFRRFLALLS